MIIIKNDSHKTEIKKKCMKKLKGVIVLNFDDFAFFPLRNNTKE